MFTTTRFLVTQWLSVPGDQGSYASRGEHFSGVMKTSVKMDVDSLRPTSTVGIDVNQTDVFMVDVNQTEIFYWSTLLVGVNHRRRPLSFLWSTSG